MDFIRYTENLISMILIFEIEDFVLFKFLMNVLCGCNSNTILILITAHKVNVLPYI